MKSGFTLLFVYEASEALPFLFCMKRFALICLFLLAGIFMSAQEHVSFKGISMGEKLSSFTQQLTKEGFKSNSSFTGDTYKGFEGEFMGKSSIIIVYHTDSGVINHIVVLQEYTSWNRLSSAFDDAAELFTKKYGKPSDTFKFFQDPYYKGDGYELQAIRNDKCHYFYVWQIPNGNIAITFRYFAGDYYLSITYEDDYNQNLRDAEADKKAYDDI